MTPLALSPSQSGVQTKALIPRGVGAFVILAAAPDPPVEAR